MNRTLADDKRAMREWQDISRGWDQNQAQRAGLVCSRRAIRRIPH